MVKSPKFLKNLLTTASALAIVSLSATSASAGARTTNAPASTAGGLVLTGFDNAVYNPAGDTLTYGQDNHVITTSAALDIAAHGLDINGKAGTIFDVKHAVTAGAAVDLGVALLRVSDAAGSITVQDIAGDITVSAGNLTRARNIGNDLTVSGGVVTTITGVGRDVIQTGGSITQTGGIGRNLNVSGAASVFTGGAATDVVGTVTLADGTATIHNAGGAVAVSSGTLNLTGARGNVTQTGGTINQAGAIIGNLDVSKAGSIFAGDIAATDIGGTVTLNANLGTGTVKIHNAAGAVAVAGGTLDLTNAAANVTQTGGKINQAGTVGGNLNVSGAGSIYAGDAAATDVTGSVTLNADLAAGTVTLHDVVRDVTVGGGTLTMHDITGVHNMTVTGGTVTARNVRGNLTNTLGTVTVNDIVGTVGLNGAGTTKIHTATGVLTVAGGHTTEVSGDLTAGVTFTSDEKVTLKTDADHDIGDVIAAAGGSGTIIANEAMGKTLRFTGVAGTAVNPLKLLEAKNIGRIELQRASAIKKIDVGAQDATINIGRAGGAVYKIDELAHENGKVTLAVTEAAQLDKGTVVSTDTNKIKAVQFVGDRVLTLQDGVNLYTTEGFKNNGVGQGSVVATGDVTLAGKIGANNTFGDVEINSAGTTKTLKILDEVNLANNKDVIVNNTDTVIFNKNVTARNIRGAAAGKGTVTFANAEAIKVDANVSDGPNTLEKVNISGANLEITKKLAPVTLAFTEANSTTVLKLSGTGLAAPDFTNTIITSESDKVGITLANAVNFGNAVGTEAKKFGTFTFLNDGVVNVTTDKFYASIATDVKDQVSLNLTNAAGARVQNIGTFDKPIKITRFVENAEVFGDAYSKDFEVLEGKTATFNGKVSGENAVSLKGANGANAVFKDGSSLLTKVVTETDGKSTATFFGSTLTSADVGTSGEKLLTVTFDNTANNRSGLQELGADIHATNIDFTSANIETIAENVTLNGTTTSTNTNLILPSGTNLKYTGGTTNPFTGTTVIVTEFDGVGIGHIQADGKNTVVDFSAVAAGSKVALVSTKGGRVSGNRTFTLVNETNGGVVNLGSNFDFSSLPTSNDFVQWQVLDKAKGVFQVTDNAAAGAQKVLKAVNADANTLEAAKMIFDAPEGTSTYGYGEELAEFGTDKPEEFKNSIQRNTNLTSSIVADAVNQAIAQTSAATIGARIETLANPAALRVTQASDGISAGAEDTLRYGVWGSPFYSQGVQKMRKGVSGYKAKTVGGTVGFDTMANDTMIVGIAATVAKTDMKHRDINSGDKTKADTLMVSIYGLQEINNDYFLQGVANFGSTKVKNTSGRKGYNNGAIDMKTATAKYDSMSWGGEVLGGYNLNVSALGVVTPMLGLDYTRTNDGGYTETGTRNQNQTVSKKSLDRIRLVAGVRAVMANIEQSGFVVTPEVHGFVKQALNDKKAKIDARLNGETVIPVKSVKPAKTSGNLGLGLNASSGMMSYGLTYDAHLANKYTGHQGTFKLRVNF